ncbi:MAG: two-component regulator propeller domain-containing protein [Fusobacteriota bacterium]
MRKKLIKITVMIFFIIFNMSFSFNFGTITTENGISSDEVMCVTQDNNGFLWIGTKSGLNRYDGYKSKIYTQNNGLPDNYINTLYVDNEDNLWIGTGIGLSKLNLKTEEMKNFSKKDGFNENQMIMDIIKGKKGNIWVASLKNGLMKYDISKGKFKNIKEISKNGTSLAQDRDGNIWVGTYDGLYMIDNNENIIKKGSEILLDNWIQDIMIGNKENTIWITAKDKGISEYNYTNNQIKHYDIDKNNENYNINSLIRTIDQDKKGNIWVGTATKGLLLLEKGMDIFSRYYYQPRDENSLPGNAVVDLYIGNQDIVWLATNGNGLAKYDEAKNKFILYKNNPNNPTSLPKGKVTATYKNNQGDLWVGLYDNGVARLKKGSTKFEHFTTGTDSKIKISADRIFDILEIEEENELWIGSVGGGLDIIDLETGEKKNFKDGVGGFVAENNTAFRIFQDRSGIIWVTTYYSGLNKYNRKTNTFKNYQHDPKNENSLSHNTIDSIYQDSDGYMWLGTDNGLNKFNIQTEKFTRFYYEESNSNSISSNIIISLNEDKDNNLWIGTYNTGINKMNLKTGKITRFGKEIGLPDLAILTILFDESGNIWMGTKDGLCKFNPETKSFQHFTKEDGLQGNQFYFNTEFKDDEGYMYVGGVKGLNKFHPENIKRIQYDPDIKLTEFSTINREIRGIEFRDKVELDYNENSFKIGFSALNFSRGTQRYRYKIVGEEDTWMDLGREHFLTFSQMKPGDYHLKVQTTTASGDWSDKSLEFIISVNPPIWRTWWAYLIYIFIFIGIFMSWKKIEDDKREKEYLKKREKEVEKLARKKQEFTAKLVHDIRSPIGGILGTIELLEAKDKEGKYGKYFNMIKSSGGLLMTIVNNLLDLEKLKSNEMQLHITPVDLIKTINEVITMYELEAENRGLKLYFENNTNLEQKILGDKFRIRQVLINLVQNAIKFTYEGSVGITLNQKQKTEEKIILELIIKDTGVGISKKDQKELFHKFTQVNKKASELYVGSGLGLNIVQELVDLMGGDITLKSEVDKGTRFIINLEFPLNKN